jgi:hypothetical protein
MPCNAPNPVISDAAAALTAGNDSTISLFACSSQKSSSGSDGALW